MDLVYFYKVLKHNCYFCLHDAIVDPLVVAYLDNAPPVVEQKVVESLVVPLTPPKVHLPVVSSLVEVQPKIPQLDFPHAGQVIHDKKVSHYIRSSWIHQSQKKRRMHIF